MNKTHLEEITGRLKKLERKVNLNSLLKGFLRFLFFFSLLAMLFVLIEFIFHFNSGARTVLFYLMIFSSTVLLLAFIFRPAYQSLSKLDIFSAADKAGAAHPQIKDELKNALQLLKENEDKSYSKDLIEAAFERVYLKAKNFNFSSAVKMEPVKKAFRNSTLVFLLAVLIIFAVPGFYSSAFRIINYNKEFILPPKFIFEVSPGNAILTKGEDLNISLKINGDLPNAFYLRTKSVEDAGFSSKKINTDSSILYSERIQNIKRSLEYFAEAGEIKSKTFKVNVIDRPQIKNLTLNIQPPKYSGVPNSVQKDNGNITGLPGTKILLKLESTKNLIDAEIIFNDSSKMSMNIDQKRALAEFKVMEDDEYSINIYDDEELRNNFPIVYNIKTLKDENPKVDIVSPAKDLNLPIDEIIFLSASISDDYGFRKLNLNYRVSSSKYGEAEPDFTIAEIPVNKGETIQDVYHTWDLTQMRLGSEDVVSYFLEVFDNDNINGPKSAKSKIYKLRVPSMDELFVEADEVHKSAEDELVETLKEAQKLNEEIEEISAELKKDGREINWNEKEKIENAMKKFEELGEKVEEVKEKIDEMKNELQQNELLSEETLKKYSELQQLFDEMNSDELKNAFEKMDDMLKDLARKNVQNSFEELKQNEDFFKKSIERTINLLKKIQVEQKVDELVKRTEELTKQQEELLKDTDASQQNKSDENNLEKRQEEISDAVKKMEEQMKELREKMGELDDMPLEDMEKIAEKFEEQQNQKLSEEAQKNLMQKMSEKAMQKQEQLSKNMQQMKQDMQQMQNSMQKQNQMMTMQSMMKITDDLLTMSREQEKLKSSTQELQPGVEKFKQNAAEQNQLSGNMDKILKEMSDLSQKSFAITPEMGKAMGKAKSEMNMSVSALQNKNGNLAAIRQKNAMKNLNEAAQMMQGMMNQMMNGGAGGGMMSMMQQMQKLSQQQMSLNQLTQQLNRGEMSQQQMSQLQKLAQQQNMIRKSLQQLNNESKAAGESKKLSGNLEKILEEMQEAVTRMNTQKVNDELVKQQERILSKLLDVQRSMNERDFDKKRESRSGELIARESPPELNLDTEEGRDKIRDELIRMAREGYTRDYEEIIKKYFEALESSED